MIIDTVTKIYNPITNQATSYEIRFVNSNISISVPFNEDNSDYQKIMEWVAEGNTITDNGGGE